MSVRTIPSPQQLLHMFVHASSSVVAITCFISLAPSATSIREYRHHIPLHYSHWYRHHYWPSCHHRILQTDHRSSTMSVRLKPFRNSHFGILSRSVLHSSLARVTFSPACTNPSPHAGVGTLEYTHPCYHHCHHHTPHRDRHQQPHHRSGEVDSSGTYRSGRITVITGFSVLKNTVSTLGKVQLLSTAQISTDMPRTLAGLP